MLRVSIIGKQTHLEKIVVRRKKTAIRNTNKLTVGDNNLNLLTLHTRVVECYQSHLVVMD
jgi:hypothetical protein